MKKRSAVIKRNTKETEITVKLNIDGAGKTKINTGIGILDHMLDLFAFHGLFDLEIAAKGDLNIDKHHTNEDIGITLGQAFKEALGVKKGINRNGTACWPMEKVLSCVSLDICGRPFYKFSANVGEGTKDESGYSLKEAEHFFEAFANHLGMNLHIKVEPTVYDLHTTLEPVFKALGKSLSEACQINPRRKDVPSTKGVID